ncbi:sulfotransferase [Thalassotalea ponticola]|uniref:sulfotransferase family protein n=1 Tax=Thalassotalea ponticola TaxID=1523392 RepID=UPI0025B613C2|nr:sulfotransferase family protein [Thalassotalea ponticola]MDN3651257.1 sulfotransferase [Thalassotalea ponticola]
MSNIRPPNSGNSASTADKLLIVGLPRTATTSVCVALLELGFNVAHTAYTKRAIQRAEVIADTPVFSHYPLLNDAYPNSRFIYLQRDIDAWVLSIRRLLERMFDNLMRSDGGFNPYIKQSFLTVFAPLTRENLASDQFLRACYYRHQQQVVDYCQRHKRELLSINVSDDNAFEQLCQFVNATPSSTVQGFKPINVGGKVIAWNKVRHPNKIPATDNGRVDSDLFAYLTSLADAN